MISSMFPNGTLTASLHTSSVGSSTLLGIPSSSVYTILYLSINREGGTGQVSILSGNDLLHNSHEAGHTNFFSPYYVSSSLYAVRTGTGVQESHFIVGYLPYDARNHPTETQIGYWGIALLIVLTSFVVLDFLRRVFTMRG